MGKNSLTELFIKLSNPDKNSGISRWVDVSEFIGEYQSLNLGNGLSWGRKNSPLAKKYIIETDKTITKGSKIDRIRLSGYNTTSSFNQSINPKIVNKLKHQRCVFTGVNGKSENTIIEIDHKDGQKNDLRVSNMKTQREDDFQPTCKALNDIKRQVCKMCVKTGLRFDASIIPGNLLKWYDGNEYLNQSGCKGCYYYDPKKYRETQIEMARKGLL